MPWPNRDMNQGGSLRTKTITCKAGFSGIELIQCPGYGVSLYNERQSQHCVLSGFGWACKLPYH
jgi:hypothetical protein